MGVYQRCEINKIGKNKKIKNKKLITTNRFL